MFKLIAQFFVSIAAEQSAYMAKEANASYELLEIYFEAEKERERCWHAVLDGIEDKLDRVAYGSPEFLALYRAWDHYLEMHTNDSCLQWSKESSSQ